MVLELSDLAKRYGDVVALDGVSFAVEPGQLVGFLGPNGAGKTTAMRIVMGLARADRGTVRFAGSPVDMRVRLRFGYMPEERGLYARMTARDQLVYFARLHGIDGREAGRRADHWLESLGLSDRADSRVEELSQGNQQRVQLGVALVHGPDLLVLDEPFGGLDPLGVQALQQVLTEVAAGGVGVVFSSHQLDLVEGLCDRVVMLDHGRIVLSGPIEQVTGAGAPRLLVGIDGDTAAWASQVPWISVVDHRDGAVLVELDDGYDRRDLVAAAAQAGELTHLSTERPSLSELFRQALAR